MFWIIICLLIAVLVAVFFDAVRQHPLGTMLLLSTTVYFLWRAYSFLTGSQTNDPLIWKILGGTAALMIVVGTVGAMLARRKAGRK